MFGANHVAVLGRAPQDYAESDVHGVALRFLSARGTIRTHLGRPPRTFSSRCPPDRTECGGQESASSPKPLAR